TLPSDISLTHRQHLRAEMAEAVANLRRMAEENGQPNQESQRLQREIIRWGKALRLPLPTKKEVKKDAKPETVHEDRKKIEDFLNDIRFAPFIASSSEEKAIQVFMAGIPPAMEGIPPASFKARLVKSVWRSPESLGLGKVLEALNKG